jgi:hypothetical protein
MKISATRQSLIEKGLALGVNFKSGTTLSGQKTFCLVCPR